MKKGNGYSEETNSFLKITNENNSFSIRISGCWRNPNYLPEKLIDKLKNLLKLRSQNDSELHVEQNKKRGDKIKIGEKE